MSPKYFLLILTVFLFNVEIFNTSLKSSKIKEIYDNESSGKNWDGTDREESLCSDTMTPLICNETLYISNRTKLGTGSGDSGSTWLHSIDQNSTPYSFNYIGDGYSSSNGGYNALGYNPKDNFMYALYGTHLLKIDRYAKVVDLGAVVGLSKQLYAGAFDREGNYFVSGNGGADDRMYKIDIDKKSVIKTLNLRYSMRGKNEPVRFWDMAIDKSGQYFYAMLIDKNDNNKNDKFIKIDKDTGIMSVIKDKPIGLTSAIDLIFSDKDGDVFLMEHDNGFYKIDSDSGDLYKISSTDRLTYYNDSANCPDANISEPSTISIENRVIDFEGDYGKKTFAFHISFTKPAPADAGFWVKYSDGTAFHIDAHPTDGDFSGEDRYIDIPQGVTTYEINASIFGDIEIEPDEEFYIEIYGARNLAIKNGKGVGVIVNDDSTSFNIERVGSDSIKPKNEDEQREKESLYTQIAGRDFNYAIVSYDKNVSNFKEYPIEDTTLKIEVIDNNSSTAEVLYRYYKYLDHKDSRFNITTEDKDMLKLKATKEAIYKISYLEYNKTIVKGDYSNGEAFENNSSVKSLYARDSFAIRPLSYAIDIKDNKDELYATNNNSQKSINLVSGYKYRVTARAIKDSNSNGDSNKNVTALNYSTSSPKEINATIRFNDKSNKLKCKNENNITLSDNGDFNYRFTYGELQNGTIFHNNVGPYSFHLADINWTYIDKINSNQIGCVLGSDSNNPADDPSGQNRIGCNFSSNNSGNIKDIEINFKAYQFNLCNTTLKNRPNNGKDYIYMSNLNSSLDMGIDISTDIIAEGKDGTPLTNFTKSCVAKDVNIYLNYNITNEKLNSASTYNSLNTVKGTEVKFKRVVSYNSNNFDINNAVEGHLDNNITISSDDFLDSNEGNSSVDILYNINKNLSEQINPIKIAFNSLDANSTSSSSKVEDKDRVPQKSVGSGTLNSVKTLYYSSVIPDKENYPDSFTSSISTPVGAYIYCDFNRTLCNDMIGVNGLNSSKTQMGWYLATLHNSITDGTINPSQSNILSAHNNRLNSVSITPNPILNFNQGRRGRLENLKTNFIGSVISLTKPIDVEVNLNPSPWLSYHPNPSRGGNPFYHIIYRGDNSGTISGIGNTGNIIKIKANKKATNRMDW